MPILKEGAGLDFVLANGELTVTVDPTEVASIMLAGEDAALLGSGAATDGHVLTADGAGGSAWEAPSGGLSAGDDASLLGSGAAGDGQVLTADGAGGAAWEATSSQASSTIDVVASRDIQESDHNNVLMTSGTITLTLPSGLSDDRIVMVIVESGVTTIAAGAGATLDGGDFDLDASNGVASATLIHETGGQWYALYSVPATPRPAIVDVVSSANLTLTSEHDGAIIQLGSGATATTGSGISAGWSCTIVRVTSGTATIARGTGDALYGPGGDAASFTIDNQWEAAAMYCAAADQFVLLGPVT